MKRDVDPAWYVWRGTHCVREALLRCEKCVIKVTLMFCCMVLLYTEDIHARVHNPKKYTADVPQPKKQPTPLLDQSMVTPLMQNNDTVTNTKKLMSCLTVMFPQYVFLSSNRHIHIKCLCIMHRHFILTKKIFLKKHHCRSQR